MINSDPTRPTNTPASSRLIQFAYYKFDAYCPRAVARTSREPVRKILVLELKTEESCHFWSFRPDSLLGDRPIHHVHETPRVARCQKHFPIKPYYRLRRHSQKNHSTPSDIPLSSEFAAKSLPAYTFSGH